MTLRNCLAYVSGDQYICGACALTWDRGDPEPPACPRRNFTRPQTAEVLPFRGVEKIDLARTQVAGNHYGHLRLHPDQFAARNGWDSYAFSALKYLTRYRKKAGAEDLKKARHFIVRRFDHRFEDNLMPVLRPAVTMDHYIVVNDIHRDDWSVLHALEDLLRLHPQERTHDGAASRYEVASQTMVDLIDHLARRADGIGVPAKSL